MPRASSTPRPPVQTAAGAFAADQWADLIRLPAEVMVATISAFASRDGATSRRTVAEGLAGLDAIAAGRAYDSYLVRAVVSSIYAESEPGEDPSPERARLLADCRRVGQVLRDSADPGDAAAYRHWVQQVVVRVCRAAHSDGVQRWSGPYQLGPAERDFVDELATALG